MTIDAANIVQLIFAFHAAFFAVFIFAKAQRPALTIFLAAFSAHMLLNFLAESAAIEWAAQGTHAFGCLFGPLLFLFVRELTRSDFRLAPAHAAHALPAIAVLLLPLELPVMRLVAVASITTYFALAIRDIARYAAATRRLRTDADAINLRWLIFVIAAFGGLSIIDIARIMLQGRLPAVVNDAGYFLVLAAVLALINVVILRAMRQTQLFAGFSGADLRTSEETAAAPAEITDDDQRAFEKLQASVIENGYFREPRLTLQELADRLGSDGRELSRLINTVSDRNFSDFINRIRVEETKRLMAAPGNEDRPLLNLGLEAGFNSKTAFNHCFKKETGMTPGEYRHQRRAQGQAEKAPPEASTA